ncbi:unnamed protein product, partial [Acanthoscelides obtectus]
ILAGKQGKLLRYVFYPGRSIDLLQSVAAAHEVCRLPPIRTRILSLRPRQLGVGRVLTSDDRSKWAACAIATRPRCNSNATEVRKCSGRWSETS